MSHQDQSCWSVVASKIFGFCGFVPQTNHPSPSSAKTRVRTGNVDCCNCCNAGIPETNEDQGTEYVDEDDDLLGSNLNNGQVGNLATSQTPIQLQPLRKKQNHSQKTNQNISPQAQNVLLSIPGATRSSSSFLSSFYKAVEVVERDPVYLDIHKYVKNGQVDNCKIDVTQIIRIVRNNDQEFEHDNELSNKFRMMLWQGSKLANIASILQNGYQLSHSPCGPGIIFTDRVSKSNFCDRTPFGSRAYLLLCDVLLGEMYHARGVPSQLNQVPSRYDSVMCTGKLVPDRAENSELSGSIIPCGSTINNTKFPSYDVTYNEYIVDDGSKIKIMYLVELAFN